MEKKPVGRRIKRLRDKRAWTQEHLAAVAGVSVRTVQRAEEGTLSADTLSALAGAFDESPEALTAGDDYPAVVPVLVYARPESVDWLVDAFGFEVRLKFLYPDGSLAHCELQVGDGLIMIGSPEKSFGWKTPEALGGVRTQSVYVHVADAAATLERARSRGATILAELETSHGQIRFRALDPEGHMWTFAEIVS